MKTTGAYSVSDEHQYQVQIGSKLTPEYPVKSLSGSLSQLRETVGGSFGRWYRIRKYIIGFDFEKASGAGFIGMSTKSGDLMTLNFRDCNVEGLGECIVPLITIVSLISKIPAFKCLVEVKHHN